MADDPSPEEQERRFRERNDDALDGMILMSGDSVAFAGPKAVLGQQQEDDDEAMSDDATEYEDVVADGSEYVPPEE